MYDHIVRALILSDMNGADICESNNTNGHNTWARIYLVESILSRMVITIVSIMF